MACIQPDPEAVILDPTLLIPDPTPLISDPIKVRTIRKVMVVGWWKKNKNKKNHFMQGEMAEKQIPAKRKVEKKNSCRRKSPIVAII